MRRYPALAVALLSCAMSGRAQTTAPAAAAPETELQRVLKKLGEEAVELEKSLPSFTCAENVVSQELRDGKVRHSVTFTATLRAQRKADGHLDESFQITTLDGRPFTNGRVAAPVMMSGGFDQAMRYFHPEQQLCYEFRLSPGRIDFKTTTDSLSHGCPEKDMAGFALLDTAGDVSYLERTVPVKAAKPLKLATYAAVTFAPVKMGDTTYRLSSHVVGEMPHGKSIGRFDATYSNCRLFKSTVTIGPAEMLPEDSSASKP
jgi:hypothetical protein